MTIASRSSSNIAPHAIAGMDRELTQCDDTLALQPVQADPNQSSVEPAFLDQRITAVLAQGSLPWPFTEPRALPAAFAPPPYMSASPP